MRRALRVAALSCLAWCFATQPLMRQDPSIKAQPLAPGRTFNSTPGGIFGNTPKVNSALPLNLEADQLIYESRGGRVVARGNVQVFYNNFVLTADEIIYDQSANLLTAKGNVQLRDPNGNVTRAESLQLTDDFRDAFAQQLSVVTADESRISARRATRRDGNVSEYEQGKFTPCRNDPGQPPLWCISAARIIHDQRAATIQYQDAKFEILGVPVIGLPYFEHADPSVKRRSGFLAPSFGTSSTLGFRFEVPYYFALAPSYDFTFNPEYLASRACCTRASGASASPTASSTSASASSTRIRASCRVTPIRASTAGAARSRRAACSRWDRGGRPAGTSRSRATSRSAASTASTGCCRPTASTPCS